MHSIFGDIPTWLLAIFTPISIIVGFIIAQRQLVQTKKIEEQKFFLELDNRFSQSDNKSVSRSIINELEHSEPFHIVDVETEFNVTNYLNDLETLCNLYEEKIVTMKQLDTLYGMQLIEAMESESIRNFMETKRIQKHTPSLWNGIENAVKELKKIPENTSA